MTARQPRQEDVGMECTTENAQTPVIGLGIQAVGFRVRLGASTHTNKHTHTHTHTHAHKHTPARAHTQTHTHTGSPLWDSGRLVVWVAGNGFLHLSTPWCFV